MSKQYNKITFIGHLGADPEMRYVPSGKPVTSFNVASNDQYTNDQGETVRTTTWYHCEAWGKLAEICNQYLHTGSFILVEGKLVPDKTSGRPRIWTRQDGSPAADFEVNVRELYFLDNRKDAAQQGAENAPASEEDLPY